MTVKNLNLPSSNVYPTFPVAREWTCVYYMILYEQLTDESHAQVIQHKMYTNMDTELAIRIIRDCLIN